MLRSAEPLRKIEHLRRGAFRRIGEDFDRRPCDAADDRVAESIDVRIAAPELWQRHGDLAQTPETFGTRADPHRSLERVDEGLGHALAPVAAERIHQLRQRRHGSLWVEDHVVDRPQRVDQRRQTREAGRDDVVPRAALVEIETLGDAIIDEHRQQGSRTDRVHPPEQSDLPVCLLCIHPAHVLEIELDQPLERIDLARRLGRERDFLPAEPDRAGAVPGFALIQRRLERLRRGQAAEGEPARPRELRLVAAVAGVVARVAQRHLAAPPAARLLFHRSRCGRTLAIAHAIAALLQSRSDLLVGQQDRMRAAAEDGQCCLMNQIRRHVLAHCAAKGRAR